MMMMNWSGQAARSVLALVGVLTACDRSVSPTLSPGPQLIAIGGESGSVRIVDEGLGRIVAELGPVARYAGPAAAIPGSHTIAFIAVDSSGRTLVGVDAQTQTLTTLIRLDSPVARHQVDSVWIRAGGMAFDATGQHAVLGSAYKTDPDGAVVPDTEFVAVVDLRSGHLMATIPFQVRGASALAAIAPNAVFPRGGIVALGSRRPLGSVAQTPDMLIVIDAGTFAVVDSATLQASTQVSRNLLRQVVVARDGSAAFITSDDGRVFAYDLVNHVVAHSVQMSPASLAVAPDGQRLYATNGGSLIDSPGSGVILVMTPDLRIVDSIDLRNLAALDHVVPALGDPLIDDAGTTLFLAAGTSSIGPLFGTQPLRVLRVDLASRKLVSAIPLGDYGGAELFFVR
jgi:hypothetical protein